MEDVVLCVIHWHGQKVCVLFMPELCTMKILYDASMFIKALYTWSDLHTCANFAYMQNLHTYANRSMCTHLLTYAKFARMQKLENLHLPQTKCKSNFAYIQILHMQIWSCERKAKFAHVSI